MTTNGIVLDGLLSEAFRIKAYTEGIIKSKNLDNPYEHNTMGKDKILTNTWLVEEALLTLVLHDKVFIDSYMKKGSNIEWLNGSVKNPHCYNYQNLIDEDAIGFRKEKFDPINQTNTVVDEKFFSLNRSLIKEYILNSMHIKKSGYESIEDIEKCLEKISSILNKQQGNSGFEIDSLYVEHENKWPAIRNFFSAYNELHSMFTTSEHLNLPIKSIFDLKHPESSTPCADMKSSNMNRVYKIILEEDCTFPAPRTLKSALTLRNDPNIKAFREMTGYWAKAILEDPTEAMLLRKEIHKAKKGLERLAGYKKIGRILAFASIPVAAASILSGLPLGLALTPIGPATVIDSIRREKKYNWLLFGKS